MKVEILPIFFLGFVFCSCKKSISSEDACAALESIKIHSNSPVNIGQKMFLSTPEIGGLRTYFWTGPNNYKSGEPSDSIIGAELKNEGWYYLRVIRNDCANTVKADSIYFDVKLLQGSPACTVPVNTTIYSNLFDDNYSIIRKSINPAFNVLTLSADGNMNILFHPVWKTIEPEDGIYNTISTEFFDQTDLNYNKVYVTTRKQSIYWGSQPGQKVYVSHIMGKLQVRFCDLKMSGNNGTAYTTAATGNLIEQ